MFDEWHQRLRVVARKKKQREVTKEGAAPIAPTDTYLAPLKVAY